MTFVFLHGVGANWTVWKKEVSYFKRHGYSTIALDFRGHGKSDMPPEFEKYRPPCFSHDIFCVLTAERIRQFALVGHSLGGAIAINYCMLYKRQYPCCLILVESTATFPFQHNRLFNRGPYLTHFLHFVANHELTRNEHFTHFDDVDLSASGVEEKIHLISHLLHLTPLRSIVKTLDNVERYVFRNKGKIEETLKHLHVPTLLVAGEFDRIVPPKYSERIKKLDERAELRVIPKAYHRVIINHPAKVCHIIEEFIGQKVLKN